MKGQMFKRVFISFTAIVLFITFIPLSGFAEVPKKINYQGHLTDSSGAVDDTVTMTFSIYDVDTGGTALWAETHSSVTVDQGVFSVVLGSVDEAGNPLDLPFQVQYYLGVTVGTDDEMTPRQPLTSAPYALNAGSADMAYDIEDGLVTSAKISVGAVTAGKIAEGAVGSLEIVDSSLTGADIVDSSITGDDLAPGVVPDGHSLDAADGSPTDAVYVDNDGNVGIGTTDPSAELHIKGDSRIEGITGTQAYTSYTYTKGADQDIDCFGSEPLKCECDTSSNTEDCGSGFVTLSDEGSYCRDYYWDLFDCRRIVYNRTATNTLTATNPRYIHINDNSNLGIGTTNPQGQLHIEDVIYDRGLLGCPPGYIGGDFDGEADETDCKAVGIVVKTDGRVGIGTTTPVNALDVSGTVTANGSVGIGTTSPKKKLHVNGEYYGKGHVYLYAYEGDGTSGTAYLQARDDSGTSDIGLQLRTQEAGSMVNALKIDSSGNVGIRTAIPSTELDVAGTVTADALDVSGGIINDFAIFKDVKSQGTPGGDYESPYWHTRTLNTTSASYGSSIKLCTGDGAPEPECTADSQIWLSAGTYLVEGRAPSFGVGRHKAFFLNRTDSIWEIIGSSAYSNPGYHGYSDSIIKGVVTVTAPKVFEILQQCRETYLVHGLGVETNIPGWDEVYTEVYIKKLR